MSATCTWPDSRHVRGETCIQCLREEGRFHHITRMDYRGTEPEGRISSSFSETRLFHL